MGGRDLFIAGGDSLEVKTLRLPAPVSLLNRFCRLHDLPHRPRGLHELLRLGNLRPA